MASAVDVPEPRETPPWGASAVSGLGLAARLLARREANVVIVIGVVCALIAFTPARDTFFSGPNIQNVLRQLALLAIFAIGETIVIIAGGIDLSLGSLISFSGMLMALVATRLAVRVLDPIAVSAGILATLAASVLIGAFHATVIHKLRLPAFVVTLASLLILRSESRMLNDRVQISIQDFAGLRYLANGNLFEGHWFAIPVPLVILVVIAAAAVLVLSRTQMGRYVYSIGCNEAATRLSGVNVLRVKLFAYGASAFLGGVAGVLWAAYSGQGDPTIGDAFELDAVAASVVGGASLMGGQGSVVGTVLGAALLHVIFSAINMTLSSPDLWRGTVVGGVLLLAVLVTALRQRQAD